MIAANRHHTFGETMGAQISLVSPYYENPLMLRKQLETWAEWPQSARDAFRFIVVDDGSPQHPAEAVCAEYALPLNFTLLRVEVDRPWNQHGARNLGAHVADTPLLMMIDIDHVVPAGTADALAKFFGTVGHGNKWFKFPRIRHGKADETRAKDVRLGVPPDADLACVGPGLNIYLCPRDAYWRAGAYNESFCGTLCGDSQFLRELAADLGPPVVLDCALHVHTRHSIPDANTTGLSRDPEPGRKLVAAARAAGTVRGHAPYLRFPWHRVF